MLLRIASWLFQLPGRLFAPIFRNRLTILIFFMLVAASIFAAKRHLYTQQHQETVALTTPKNYQIPREVPLREAREHCGGPLLDNQGQPWPTAAGYLQQPQWPAGSSLREFTLDNRQNAFAILVKLENTLAPQQPAEVFIPAAGSFTVKMDAAGEYVMKAKDLKSGCSFRSATLSVAEHQGGQLSLKLSGEDSELYHPISDSEF
ncbi:MULTISPECIES: hypothetical protein [unclassified Serratia (in: enterobacteria)]|uniref:hypothetical protein n=1 Tax=unclassified Serratia (in: enterobacteria) TaxID=2647522 RepID=UPI0005086BD9|nr:MULTISPECIES: hypothetical protein [unclassified Serratia (in: enterobacteria)]KFK97665.1 hypothetical protein JV45_02230 [Serratia sp. Ag2]KFK97980.1 hypothetical protein IV04_13855 [Serratia sp. Ag1]